MTSVTPGPLVKEVSQHYDGDKMCYPGFSHFLDTLLCESLLAPPQWVPTAMLTARPGVCWSAPIREAQVHAIFNTLSIIDS